MQRINNELALQPSSLEIVDTGLFRFVNEELNLQTRTNKGYEKVPIIWLGAERSYQIKNNKELRDSVGKLRLPLISINRENFEMDTGFQGAIKSSKSLRYLSVPNAERPIVFPSSNNLKPT